MLKRSIGGFAFLVFIFTFASPGLVGPKPANADPDLIHYYRTRVTIMGRLGIVCSIITKNETKRWTTTSHSVEDSRQPDGTHWHPINGNSPSNRIPRERTIYAGTRCR